ncbi:MAG: hypothetical protein FWG29_06415 [Treponema sp.]|jgi:hypothetical protein|nr:hypothetical protein [Treponema sp.]
MSIQKVQGMNPLRNVPFEATTRVAGMAMSNQKLQGEAVLKLLNTAQIITDPAMGNRVNILA